VKRRDERKKRGRRDGREEKREKQRASGIRTASDCGRRGVRAWEGGGGAGGRVETGRSSESEPLICVEASSGSLLALDFNAVIFLGTISWVEKDLALSAG